MEPRVLVDCLDSLFGSLRSLTAELDPDEWDLPTDCPGWSVKDNLSHIVGMESRLLGRPPPDHKAPEAAHVRNPIGESNEVDVDWRRPRPPAEVVAEFEEVAAERLADLRAYSDEDFAAESWTPLGPGTKADFLAIRLVDIWVHEQDMRRAVGRPGHREGPVAEHALDRLASGMPFVVGKKAAVPDGSSVVFEILGPSARKLAVAVQGGRARPVEPVPKLPTAIVTLDQDAFTRLACGRADPEEVLASGEVTLSGDSDLACRVVSNMNFMI
jgi:uncharacterized protein (TIGR03083 family)